jgi:HK97 family phage prohead protease
MTHRLEYKQFPLTLKAAADDAPEGVIGGYASTWAKDAYGDRIAPGAFAQSIVDKRGKYPILAVHDMWSLPIGFTNAVSEDAKGLQMSGLLALATSGGRDAFALVKAAQAVDFKMGLSIGFSTEQFEMDDDVRVLTQIDLWEISLTAFPANRLARVDEARSYRGDSEVAANKQLCTAMRSLRLRLAMLDFPGR